MSITVIYHVAVNIPEAVWRAFQDSPEYERASCEATSGHIEAGTNFYDNPFEWAEFHSLADAKACERKLHAVMQTFAAKLKPEELL
jgi:hypothetical protein